MMKTPDAFRGDEWAIIGPFGSTLAGAWDRPFPPEWEIDLYRDYEGSHGTIRWHCLYADDSGTISLCGPCWPEVSQIPTPPLKEYEVAYLFTNLLCDPPAERHIVISSPFRYKLWVDNELSARCTSVDKAERTMTVRLARRRTQLLIKIEKLLWWEWRMRVQVQAPDRPVGSSPCLRAIVEDC
jgi:hypothetical protein